jgi:hypothetical protein
MSMYKQISIATTLAWWLLSGTALSGQQVKPETSIENIFQVGLMVQDTNGDQIADAICGHVIVQSMDRARVITCRPRYARR